ncbi:MAG: hypothetical protein K1X92_14760 [Bacteroidia bacterium]|nr:hypothetical protein [Bacteroidia bacterium]
MKKVFLYVFFLAFSLCAFSQSTCHELTRNGVKSLGEKIGKYAGNGSSAGSVLGELIGEAAGIRISEWVCNTGTEEASRNVTPKGEISLPKSEYWINTGKQYIYEKSISFLISSES